jgi:hypothetical protein
MRTKLNIKTNYRNPYILVRRKKRKEIEEEKKGLIEPTLPYTFA